LRVYYHPYKRWLDEPPERGAILIFIFTAEISASGLSEL
jgi:hypothetical protein